MPQEPLILGIESSCDDTAAAILRGREILSSVVLDQGEVHAPFGGVVPELAARAHAEKLDIAAKSAFKEAGVKLEDLDAIAVTSGPGLIGGLLAGVSYAKGLAFGAEKPLIGVNHLAGHALTPRLTDGLSFPYLMLLVSGGHCLFLIAHSATDFTRLGSTIDDAPGEAFDKTAKLLGLGYPGGPKVERAACAGDPNAYKFPRPLLDRDDCNLSFSGLKTALRRETDKLVAAQGGINEAQRADLCASFQAAAADCLASKAKRAMAHFKAAYPTEEAYIAVAGGVAANKTIGNALRDEAQENGFTFTAPPMSLCTDNAAMIAWAGVERFKLGLFDDMSLEPRPRWPLDKQAMPIFGSGKKGAKA